MKNHKLITAAKPQVVEVEDPSTKVKYDGKLVLVKGIPAATKTAFDPLFQMGCVTPKLRRVVLMCQKVDLEIMAEATDGERRYATYDKK